MIKILRANAGLTLIELILYVALLSIFVSSAVVIGWNIIYSQIKNDVQQEVTSNLRFAMDRIGVEIRQASAINSITASSVSLVSSVSARNPTVIDVSGGRLRIGQGSTGACPTTSPCLITSPRVNVDSFTISNVAGTAGTTSLNYQLRISSTGNRQEWVASYIATGSATFRK